MRTRAIFTALILATACGAPVVGCQIIAGITSLEVDGGAGGSAGKVCHAAGDCPGGYCALFGDAGAAGTCEPAKMRGDSCTALDQCGADFCTGGVCCAKASCSDNLACNAKGSACNTTCATSGDCAPGNVCAPGMMSMMSAKACLACGAAPPPQTCGVGLSCETCDQNVCVKTCDTTGECMMPQMIGASVVSRILCNDQCNDISVTCVGANPCEIVCENGGCHNLHVNCSSMGGNCRLTCHGTGCGGVVTMSCGDNACDATCTDGQTVHQTPGGTCPPTKGTCN